jgi:imidazolonepropionase-like amidohydrolase
VSGPPLTADGGHCWFLGGCCSDAAALVDAVHERQRRGCNVVKIMVTGGALTPTVPMWESQFSAADVATVVAAAHAVGLPVAAHCHGIEGTSFAIAAGVDSIEHCTFMTSRERSEPDADLVGRMASAGIAVSATFGRLPDIPPPPVVEANHPTIVELMGTHIRNGDTLVVGTDAGIMPAKPHDVLPFAVRELGQVGLTGDEILRTLTSTAAAVCKVGDRKGRLAPGYDADILAVAGDPVERPERLRDVCGVWRGGRRVVGSE